MKQTGRDTSDKLDTSPTGVRVFDIPASLDKKDEHKLRRYVDRGVRGLRHWELVRLMYVVEV